jgi:hypothetical protein
VVTGAGYGYKRLMHHRDAGTPIQVLVDHRQPENAVIFREITSTMYVIPLCGLVFGLPGLGLICLGLGGFSRNRRVNQILANNPGRPWRADRRWSRFEIQDFPAKRCFSRLLVGIFFGMFVGVFWIAMGRGNEVPLFIKGILGLFTLIPVGMLVSAVYHFGHTVKYGNSRLVFKQIPLVLGQESYALLTVKSHIPAEKGVELKLRCIRRELVKHGRKSSISEQELYSETKIEPEDLAARTGRGAVIPVRFRIPADQPETSSGDLPNIIWKLSAVAVTPGIDYFAEFEVPVYRVEDPSLVEVNPMTAGRRAN